jgi:hypothetical protein
VISNGADADRDRQRFFRSRRWANSRMLFGVTISMPVMPLDDEAVDAAVHAKLRSRAMTTPAVIIGPSDRRHRIGSRRSASSPMNHFAGRRLFARPRNGVAWASLPPISRRSRSPSQGGALLGADDADTTGIL